MVELARALAQHPAVYRVDLLTRLIKDPKVDKSYGEPVECLMQSEGELGGAYIVRLPCGPQDVYLRSHPGLCSKTQPANLTLIEKEGSLHLLSFPDPKVVSRLSGPHQA